MTDPVNLIFVFGIAALCLGSRPKNPKVVLRLFAGSAGLILIGVGGTILLSGHDVLQMLTLERAPGFGRAYIAGLGFLVAGVVQFFRFLMGSRV
jgi:hypothetical protein